MFAYKEAPKDKTITAREGDQDKREEMGKSHLIVWNRNEPLSQSFVHPHSESLLFFTQMLTDCAVNHANESSTTRGLVFTVFTVPRTHTTPRVPCEKRASSTVVAVCGSGSVFMRHFLAGITLVWLRWWWEIRSWMSLKTTHVCCRKPYLL